MPPRKAVELALLMIKESLTLPSERFGDLVLTVDDKLLGRLAREFRTEMGVRATDIAKRVKRTKIVIHFLEQGARHWDKDFLIKYIEAVFFLSKDQATSLVTSKKKSK